MINKMINKNVSLKQFFCVHLAEMKILSLPAFINLDVVEM